MTSVLYLDYDGVLHADDVYRTRGRNVMIRTPGRSLFEWAPYLEQALVTFPGVRIVLSTSWVRVLGFSRARDYLPPGLRERVIGATFHRREHGPTRELREFWAQSSRGVQILRDLERRRPARWLAVDDAVDEFLPAQRGNLVACNSSLGLSDQATQEALRSMLERVASTAGSE